MFNSAQLAMINFVRQHPNCKAMEIVVGTSLNKSAIYKFLKSEYFLRSEKINGSNTGKGGGFYFTYTVNESATQSIVKLIRGDISRTVVKPKIPKRDELTNAFFGSIA